ncbi:hypothetical protein ABFT23_05905 [Nocardioides sp. C4-1]|uniref:ATP-grasp domain-containing protein n=1 Tax=Nocardioides sp. C4-1 TaxID=3151851 RepID=UPI0032649F37
MTDVLLATSAGYRDGEPGHEALDAALAARGVSAAWAVWDDPSVDWSAAGLVCVRSTWDYQQRLPEFLVWAEGVGPSLLHGLDTFRWNTDKSYLLDLAARVPTVPTVLADDDAGLRDVVSGLGAAVVKPRVGAGGEGLVVVRRDDDPLPVDGGPWVVQPLLDSVHDEGELSVFVLDRRPVSQVAKIAPPDDVRVHEEYGGRSSVVALTPEARDLAVAAVAATAEIVGAEIVYARIDLLRLDGRLHVSEVEVTEPGLYLDVVPANAEAFAEVVAARLPSSRA